MPRDAGLSDRSGRPDAGGRHETPAQRLDRNWNELLQELRVAQTGAQILAAFLLTVPFQQRFEQISHGQLILYLTSVGLAGLTTGLLVAPVAWHRMSFRQGQRARLVRWANRAARAGLLTLSLTIAATVALVFWVAVNEHEAFWAGAAALVVLVGGWFVVPLLALRRVEE